MSEVSLNYVITLTAVEDPEGLSLQVNGNFEREHNILATTSTDDKFQRLSIYKKGVIISEEVYNNACVFRFNVPFTQELKVVTLDN
ncbi:hypothetical protein [Desemzia sp. FAM 24101]|uniref:hypothetical protein n=1 Tax=unclassified Desemzia TaxID=2685243 RepID=UPI00388AC067